VVTAEVYVGLRPLDRERGDDLFGGLRFLPSSPAAAKRAGLWRYEEARRGRQAATSDSSIAAIAAIAIEHAAILVTGNVAHFQVPGLTLHELPRDGGGPARR